MSSTPGRTRNGIYLAMAAALLAAAVPADVSLDGRPIRNLSAQQNIRVDENADRRILIIRRANMMILERRYEDAIELLEGSLAGGREDNPLVELLARAYLRAGMPGRVVELLTGMVERYPDEFTFVRDLGLAWLDLGEPETAVRTWHSILDSSERKAPYYLSVARLEWDSGMYDRAIETLREGRKIPTYYGRYTQEIVRLEKTRGELGAAFSEGLGWVAAESAQGMARFSQVFEVFREAGRPREMVEEADSVLAGGGERRWLRQGFLAVLRIEAGEYAGAREFLEAARAGQVDERTFFDVLSYIFTLDHKRGSAGYDKYLYDAARIFIERHGGSPMAPKVLLMAAESEESAAARRGEGWKESARTAAALADSVIGHPGGAQYAERAALLKAGVLLDHLADPAGALEVIEGHRWRRADTAVPAERLRQRALLASGSYDEAWGRYERIAARGDSASVAAGRYGMGVVHFLRGEYRAAVDTLSSMAKEAPWSDYANDALDRAAMVKKALGEGEPALDIYRAGRILHRRGLEREAADTLAALAGRFPRSSLAPRALFESAEMLELAADPAAASGRYRRVAEDYPLSPWAPRALERVASMEEPDDPSAAESTLALLIDRYPEYPYLSRVRKRYLEIRESTQSDNSRGNAR